MTSYRRATTDQLQHGDIVANYGMRILIDRPIDSWTGHRGPHDTDPCYGTTGTILNMADIRAAANEGCDLSRFIVSQSYETGSNGLPTGRRDCWRIQGNHLAHWSVEVKVSLVKNYATI